MKKKPKRKTLLKQWGQIIMKKYKYTCQVCGRTPARNPHHIFTRKRTSTAFLLENGINLCMGCHTGSSVLSAHMTPYEFKDWLLDKWFTQEEFDDLQLTSHLVEKFDGNKIKIFLDIELNRQKEMVAILEIRRKD